MAAEANLVPAQLQQTTRRSFNGLKAPHSGQADFRPESSPLRGDLDCRSSTLMRRPYIKTIGVGSFFIEKRTDTNNTRPLGSALTWPHPNDRGEPSPCGAGLQVSIGRDFRNSAAKPVESEHTIEGCGYRQRCRRNGSADYLTGLEEFDHNQ
jgi:hypothetical protein